MSPFYFSHFLLPIIFCMIGFVLPKSSFAQQVELPKTDKQVVQTEISELRDRVIKAYEDRDLDQLLQSFDPNVVVTWQDGKRNRGAEAFQAFYQRMIEGEDAVIEDSKITFEIDGDAKLFGSDSAVVCGSIQEKFKLKNGKDFTLESKWTASLAKSDSDWKIVSYHVSANMFDNPVMAVARFNIVLFAIAGALLGFVLGSLITWFIIRSTQKQVAEA
jgi:uncharacterized protein (TIGR02246 family)